MDNKNEILFTTEATVSFDEYAKFSNRACRFYNALSYILWIGIAGLLCVLSIRAGKHLQGIFIAVGCAIKVASSPAVRKEKQRKAFADNDSIGNCYLLYDFYEEGFVMTCNMVEGELIRYCDLWNIIETKTNFYFMFEPRNGCLVIKEKCSPELIRFLHTIKADPDGPLYNEGVKAQTQFEEDDDAPELAKRFGFSYEIINWNTPPEEIVARYKRAVQLAPVEGYPVIFENDKKVLALLDELAEEMDWENLSEQELPDGKELLQEWYRLINDGEELWEYDLEREIIPSEETGDTFVATEVFFRTMKNDDLIMLKIPVDKPWKTLAYFPLFGDDDCPNITELMAVGKYWYERYRVLPALFGINILEFLAEDIHISEEEAWLLAKEQAVFCENVLNIETESGAIGELADVLMKTKTWYFMWDPDS
ncbi:MAG: DUF4253 domain-containing protein [Roseburia sp.]|nr:DUF4253 domain-containing protein [Roseburia sp.]